MKFSKCHFFTKEIQYLRHILSTTGIRWLPVKTQAINNMHPSKTAQQVHAFPGLIGYYRKCIKDFAKMAKPLTLLTHQKAKFEWMPAHHTAFLMVKDAVTKAPILHYPANWYIVYTDAWDDACGERLSKEHNGTEFPIAFSLSHLHGCLEKMEHHQTGSLWSILCSHKIIVHNNHKPLARFLNGKNANNKVNRWRLEFATYNITFKLISGAQNKAADYLSRLVELSHDRQATV